MFYLVVEIQQDITGAVTTLNTTHTKLTDAEAQFYGVLHAASQSAVPYHGAVILTSGGTNATVYASKFFDRRADEEEPEEENAE